MKINKNKLKDFLLFSKNNVEKKDMSEATAAVFFTPTSPNTVLIEICDYEGLTEFECPCDDPQILNFNYVELLEFLKKSKDDYIEFSINGDTVKVFDINFEKNSNLYDIDKKWAPIDISMNHLDNPVDIEFSDELMACCGTGNPKRELNGVLVDFETGALVSTDTKRMCIQASPNIYHAHGEYDQHGRYIGGQIILPKTNIKPNMRLMALTDDSALFSVGDYSLRTQLINGRYPDYQRSNPKNKDKIVSKINNFELQNVIGRTKGDIRLIFQKNKLNVAALTEKAIDNIGDIDIGYPYHQPFSIMVNSKHLKDVKKDNLVLSFNGQHLPYTIDIDIEYVQHNLDNSLRMARGTRLILMPVF